MSEPIDITNQDNQKKRCNALLMAMLGSQALVEQWWVSPNRAFDMEQPVNVNKNSVEQYLMNMAYGGW
jgi:hypothetical protein